MIINVLVSQCIFLTSQIELLMYGLSLVGEFLDLLLFVQHQISAERLSQELTLPDIWQVMQHLQYLCSHSQLQLPLWARMRAINYRVLLIFDQEGIIEPTLCRGISLLLCILTFILLWIRVGSIFEEKGHQPVPSKILLLLVPESTQLFVDA